VLVTAGPKLRAQDSASASDEGFSSENLLGVVVGTLHVLNAEVAHLTR
jgi:hypothetical protein